MQTHKRSLSINLFKKNKIIYTQNIPLPHEFSHSTEIRHTQHNLTSCVSPRTHPVASFQLCACAWLFKQGNSSESIAYRLATSGGVLHTPSRELRKLNSQRRGYHDEGVSTPAHAAQLARAPGAVAESVEWKLPARGVGLIGCWSFC